MIYDHTQQTIDEVSDLSDLKPVDNQLVDTMGYYAKDDGGENLYRYSSASAVLCDGGLVLDGVGGDNSLAGLSQTYVGSGVGRYLAINNVGLRPQQYGANLGDPGDSFRVAQALSSKRWDAPLLQLTGIADPVLADLPINKDVALFEQTTSDKIYLVYNRGGVIIKSEIGGLGGGGGPFVNWEEDGTTLQPVSPGYDFGSVGNEVGPITTNGRVSQTGLGQSTIFGELAGVNDDLSDNLNTAFGFEALNTCVTGSLNVAIGYRALKNTTESSSVAVGFEALEKNTIGFQNVAIGFRALEETTDGFGNTAIGYDALTANIGGFGNSAIGDSSLKSNTTGSRNVAIGEEAMQGTETGSYNVGIGGGLTLGGTVTGGENVAIGRRAMRFTTSGNQNVGIGYDALYSNVVGDFNVAIGLFSAKENTSGRYNCAFGNSALLDNTTGDHNIAIGWSALENIDAVSNNIAIGRYAGYWVDNLGVNKNFSSVDCVAIGAGCHIYGTNSIAIGAGAGGAGDNTATWGNTSITDHYFSGDLVITGGIFLGSHINNSQETGITASTNQTQGQQPLTNDLNHISVVANTNDVVTMPSASPGLVITIFNSGSNTLQIFPASGDNLGAGVDTSVTLSSGSGAKYWSYDATNWVISP